MFKDVFNLKRSEFIYSNIKYDSFILGSLKICKKIKGDIFVYMPLNLAYIQVLFGLVYNGISYTIIDKSCNIIDYITDDCTIITDKKLKIENVNLIRVNNIVTDGKKKKFKKKSFKIKFISKNNNFEITDKQLYNNIKLLNNVIKLDSISIPPRLPMNVFIYLTLFSITNKIKLNFGDYILEGINIIHHYSYHLFYKYNNILPIIDEKYDKYITYKGNIITYNKINLKFINTNNLSISETCVISNETSKMLKYFDNDTYVIDFIKNINIEDIINKISLYIPCYCKYIDDKIVRSNENIIIYIKKGIYEEKNVIKFLSNKKNVFLMKLLIYESNNSLAIIYNPKIWNIINNIFYKIKPIYKIKFYNDKYFVYELIKFYGNIVKYIIKSIINKLKNNTNYDVKKKQIIINDVEYKNTITYDLVKIIQNNYNTCSILNVNMEKSLVIFDENDIYESRISSIKNNIFISLNKLINFSFMKNTIVGIYIFNNENFNSLINKNEKYKIIICINWKNNILDIQFYYKSSDQLFEKLYNNIIDYANANI